MRRFIIFFNLIIITFSAFAQQLPDRIIGRIPPSDSAKFYQIQVGAFRLDINAENTVALLRRNNFNPAAERYLDFTRVIIKGIPANQVNSNLVNLKRIGFNEVIIREDSSTLIPFSLSEKWEINIPESEYLSFEFNHDMNYIVIANNQFRTAYFGTYSMPQPEIIVMNDLGRLVISNNNNSGVDFKFYTLDEPDREINFSAVKAERMAASSELDLFCRTWRVVDSTDPEDIGIIVLFTNAGTYFITRPDGGSSSMSRWRWYGERRDQFEYTHENWISYGRAFINDLSANLLVFTDPGFFVFRQGYSNAGSNSIYRLVPVR
ncbi:MAG: hypothetical protein FWC01_07745 [Treponema sp.]|nr:hypothetical protein [Treponema sp.]MCL2237791.1 hypothetical protein [Treponema sp.]